MQTIYKYPFITQTVDASTIVVMPENSVVLSVGCQESENLVCWARVETALPPQIKTFRIVGTGQDIGAMEMKRFKFLGTIQTPRGLVWHVFEKIE